MIDSILGWVLTATGSYGSSLDKEMSRKALAAIVDPDGYCQVQGIPAGESGTFHGGNLEDILERADELSGNRWVYLLINPVEAGLTKCAKVGDIASRRWLMVDVDAVRPDSSQPATDDEHEAARVVADKVVDDLTSLDWPAPVLIDSGNGWHILFRVDLPADNGSRILIGRCLKKLAHAYREEKQAKIDTETNKATQSTKLPGSWARKGTNTDERPWRQARLIYAPTTANQCVSYEQLLQLAECTSEQIQEKDPTHKPRQELILYTTNGAERNHAYAMRALDSECSRIALAQPGGEQGRNVALNRAAYCMAQLAAGDCIPWSTCESRLLSEGLSVGLPERECRSVIARAYKAGMLNPRQPEDRPGWVPGQPRPKPPASESVPAGELIIIRGSEIKPRKVEWLWPGRIPLGKLTTFAGIGGLGKTFVLTDLTARVTQGREWPDAAGQATAVGQVLFISGEDDPDDTLVPRMIEAGTNLDKVIFLRTEVLDRFTLDDLKTLEIALHQAGGGVRLVCIDPPTAYLGKVDDHKNADLRGLLSPLASFAAKHRCSIIFNTHVTKGGNGKVEAMMRVMGSVAWVNAVRAAHMFGTDPEDQTRKFFVPMKMNLARQRKGLAYRIKSESTDDDAPARVEWLGECDVTADEAINKERAPRLKEAKEWLIERFSEKQEWPSDELFRQAAQDGIARKAVFNAKEALDIPKARQVTSSIGNRSWIWWVPTDWPLLSKKQESSDEQGVSF